MPTRGYALTPTVGLGGSAGGIQALTRFFEAMACNREALDKALRRKWHQWEQATGRADVFKDRRKGRSGQHNKPPFTKADYALFAARTVGCGGREDQAYRELYDEGKFSPAVYQDGRYVPSVRNKTRAPKSLRERCTPELVAELQKHHIGPKEAKLRGPKCERDWSEMPSGVQAQSDDCTLPVYFWTQLEDGSFKIMRGQFLPYIDTRTTYIYCFQLLASEGYGSIDLGRGLAQLNDSFGLPPEVYYENGIWKRSLIIAGRGDGVPWKDRVYGLKDLGIKVSHALDPSAKVIENVLGILQNRMERERGYCGRDERKDCPEHVARAKRLVESGKCQPSEYFYSHAEWVERLNQICNAYNDEAQFGKKLGGLSPRDAFVKMLAEPPIRLDETTRYLLASHRREVSVTASGLTIRIGKTPYTYKSEATGRLIGQKVLAWFDLENPSFITITSLDHTHPRQAAARHPRGTPASHPRSFRAGCAGRSRTGRKRGSASSSPPPRGGTLAIGEIKTRLLREPCKNRLGERRSCHIQGILTFDISFWTSFVRAYRRRELVSAHVSRSGN